VRPVAPLERAGDTATDEEVADLYERLLQAREAARIEEIRKACVITPAKAEGPVDTDEPAADIKAGEAPFDEPDDETAPACVRCPGGLNQSCNRTANSAHHH
jgi:hypothetical protein